MLRITMPSGIIKGSPTSCCSVGLRKLVGTGLYNVATGWVASCVTTIKRLHELAGQSWQMAVRLRPAPRSGLIVVGKRWPPTNSRVPPTFPCATGRSSYRAVTDWDSDKRRSIFALNRQDPRIIILTIRDWLQRTVVVYVALVLCCVAVVTLQVMTHPAEKAFTQSVVD